MHQAFIVESNTKPPHYLAMRIDAFLLQMKEKIAQTTDTEFTALKNAILVDLLRHDVKLP